MVFTGTGIHSGCGVLGGGRSWLGSDRVFAQAELVVASTNAKVQHAQDTIHSVERHFMYDCCEKFACHKDAL